MAKAGMASTLNNWFTNNLTIQSLTLWLMIFVYSSKINILVVSFLFYVDSI